MRISDWSSDVCSSDLRLRVRSRPVAVRAHRFTVGCADAQPEGASAALIAAAAADALRGAGRPFQRAVLLGFVFHHAGPCRERPAASTAGNGGQFRSEEHTSELQSLMRISYAVFCLKNKKKQP